MGYPYPNKGRLTTSIPVSAVLNQKVLLENIDYFNSITSLNILRISNINVIISKSDNNHFEIGFAH